MLGLFSSLVSFRLRFPTRGTLGGTPLETKTSPRPKVLATFAPLDLTTLEGRSLWSFIDDYPNLTITGSADTLVLRRNRGLLVAILFGRYLGGFGLESAF